LGRAVAVLSGLRGVPGVTVNRYCASSLQAIRMAAHAIRAGEGRSQFYHPAFSEPGARTRRMADTNDVWHDPRADGHLPDVYIAMGETAENVAEFRGISRQAQDEFGALSQQRAQRAIEAGFFDLDITPLTLADGTVIGKDDGPRKGVTVEGLAGLKPAFRPDGTVTAGNCCGLNDGAAALVVMSDSRATELGLTPLARVVSTGVSALSPEIMGLGPVEASRRALANAGMSIGDLDLIEINEAFAAQVLPTIDDLKIDPDRVNVHGGAIALGHPFGQTGARMTTTLINGLRFTDGQFGLETMCTAGGQGMAMIIERLS
jgi:acetyl-CoA C-acetyltransferase